MAEIFTDRREAGQLLGALVAESVHGNDALVLGLPRGGVPVAFEVAKALNAPLDVLVVRKLGVPGHEEFAFGSIASGGVTFVNENVVRSLRLPRPVIDQVVESERFELKRRERLYRGDAPTPEVRGRTVVLVDDGLATGSTMRAAVDSVRQLRPKRIVVAVPVCAPDAPAQFDDIDTWCICLRSPEPFYAVGLWYRDFDQTSDEEVRALLAKSRRRAVTAATV